jgi:hypothetical protein
MHTRATYKYQYRYLVLVRKRTFWNDTAILEEVTHKPISPAFSLISLSHHYGIFLCFIHPRSFLSEYPSSKTRIHHFVIISEFKASVTVKTETQILLKIQSEYTTINRREGFSRRFYSDNNKHKR